MQRERRGSNDCGKCETETENRKPGEIDARRGRRGEKKKEGARRDAVWRRKEKRNHSQTKPNTRDGGGGIFESFSDTASHPFPTRFRLQSNDPSNRIRTHRTNELEREVGNHDRNETRRLFFRARFSLSTHIHTLRHSLAFALDVARSSKKDAKR
jgi:hypothetical protein